MELDKITVIIPLNEFSEETETYAKRAFESLINSERHGVTDVIFVGPKDVCLVAEKSYSVFENMPECSTCVNDDTDVFSQINKGVFACKTPYFVVLEFDDKFTSTWFANFRKYSTVNADASIYMPIVELVNTDGKVVSFENEIAWATSFSSDELGYLDTECLKTFMDFNVTGAIIKTEDFISVGGLKPQMQIASWYEFLLRLTNEKKNVYVVPKVGYLHTVNREGSYMSESVKTISKDYGKWLIDTAREEYNFKNWQGKEYQADGNTEVTEAAE